MSDLKGEMPCATCGDPIWVDRLECNGLIDGMLDLVIDCPSCGVTLNAFLPVADLQVLE